MKPTIAFVRALCALLALLLSACGAVAPVEEKTATAEAGYGRVFGQLRYAENGKEVKWGSVFPSTDSLTLFVRSARTGQMHYLDVPADGNFFWPPERGDYTIVGFQLARRRAGTFTNAARVMPRVSVPQAGQAVYIGDLVIESRAGAGRVQVLDGYEAALQRVGERITAAKLAPIKALMVLEAASGRVGRMTGICSAYWAIECDSNYQGVRPVQPEGTERTYVRVKDLMPLLEWKPSGRPGTTYDVAIYESLDFTYGLWGSVQGLRAARVAYAEGLTEPRYAPPSLERGRRYQWSVRLRDGDTVSSWSTTSYSFFAVIAARRASGQYFGFETP